MPPKAENRFATIAPKQQQQQQPKSSKARGGGRHDDAEYEWAAADLEVPTHHVSRGFQVVEGRKPRKPPQRRDDPDTHIPGHELVHEATTKAAAAPKRRAGPVGGAIVDPEEEKQQQRLAAVRAVAAAAKAKQAPKPKPAQPKPKKSDEEWAAVSAERSAPKKAPATHAPTYGKAAAARTKGQEAWPELPEAASTGPAHADPYAASDVGAATLFSLKAPSKKGGKQAKVLSTGGPAAVAISHEHLEDGSVVAEVAFKFIIPPTSEPYTLQGVDKSEKVRLRLRDALLVPLLSNGLLRGGFFVNAEAKEWSNVFTIDEPWMAETYFKALLPLLNGDASTTVAHPYWPNTNRKEDDTTEAEVQLRLVPRTDGGRPTALELEHVDKHCAARVTLKQTRVSFRPFAEAVIREAELLSLVLPLVHDALPEAQRDSAMSRLPRRAPEWAQQLREAAAKYFA